MYIALDFFFKTESYYVVLNDLELSILNLTLFGDYSMPTMPSLLSMVYPNDDNDDEEDDDDDSGGDEEDDDDGDDEDEDDDKQYLLYKDIERMKPSNHGDH